MGYLSPPHAGAITSTSANIVRAKPTLASFCGEICKAEGFYAGLLRPGLFCNMASIFLSSSIRMGLYPVVRDALVSVKPPGAGGGPPSAGSFDMFCAGLLSGSVGYFFGAPTYQVKSRMQAEVGIFNRATGLYETGFRAGKGPMFHHRTTLQGLQRVYNEGGFGRKHGLFRGVEGMVIRGAALSVQIFYVSRILVVTHQWSDC